MIKLILGRDGVIPAMQWNVMSVPAIVAVPIGFAAFDGIARFVDAVFITDIIKDVELNSLERLSSATPVDFIYSCADGNVARIVGEDLRIRSEARGI